MHPVYLPKHNVQAPVKGLHKPWEHAALKTLSWGGIALAGLALTPVIGSAFGGDVGRAASDAITFCTTGPGKGFAQAASGGISPLLGTTVAAGGWATALLSGGLAISGLWLANYVDKHTSEGAFRWGSVIRWAALGTSILIALPALLPAISMGLLFIGSLLGPPNLVTSAASMIGSLGSAGAMSGASLGLGAAGLAGIHALTCATPLGLTSFFLGEKEENPKPILTLPALVQGRLMPMLPSARVATV